jgi:hypothetical protein
MDSFGRKPSGIMEGNFVWTGQHSQCVGINVPEWTGKYCYIRESIMWNNMTKFQFVSHQNKLWLIIIKDLSVIY